MSTTATSPTSKEFLPLILGILDLGPDETQILSAPVPCNTDRYGWPERNCVRIAEPVGA